MHEQISGATAEPTRWSSVVFLLKASVLRTQRRLREWGGDRAEQHSAGDESRGELIGESVTPLWNDANPAERDLTAGKVENLRVAVKALDGREVPAGKVVSFWKQVGKPTRRRGFVVGREVREGCIIPNIGGGLCQLSNGLYDAALRAGLEIVERHAHTRVVAGSLAEEGRDATVFWNYVDLRFRSPPEGSLFLRVMLTRTDLVVRFFGVPSQQREQIDPKDDAGVRRSARNCFTCNMSSCFRNDPMDVEQVRYGKKAFLLDAYWPEHDAWIREEMEKSDWILVPLDGKRRGKANYSWSIKGADRVMEAPVATLRRSWALRKGSRQGREYQEKLLAGDERLARAFTKRLTAEVGHVVVSQNLLPFLWRDGVLGGRTFDVLMTRLPIHELESRLGRAGELHPESETLGDFRAPEWMAGAEESALAEARRIVTAHTEIAKCFPQQVDRCRWDIKAKELSQDREIQPGTIFFPASALGRKGAYVLRDAILSTGLDLEVWVLGKARDEAFEWGAVRTRVARRDELNQSAVVVLPAYVEHQPRVVLEAMGFGVPVIVSEDCGIEAGEGVRLVPSGEVEALAQVIVEVVR